MQVVKCLAENWCHLSQGAAQSVFKIFPQIALLWLRPLSTFQNPADGEAAGGEGRRVGKKSGGGLRQHVRWLRGLLPALGECEQALTNAGREASPPGVGGFQMEKL